MTPSRPHFLDIHQQTGRVIGAQPGEGDGQLLGREDGRDDPR